MFLAFTNDEACENFIIYVARDVSTVRATQVLRRPVCPCRTLVPFDRATMIIARWYYYNKYQGNKDGNYVFFNVNEEHSLSRG